MRFLSLFSGIEAASVAWLPLGWECAAVAEIEPFPCKVLAHHYPNVPNLGDITKITQEQIKSLGHIDLVVGGFPCQDLSVAGLRKGLKNADGSATRSGLFYTALQIARWTNARWLLLENVPGIYSSNNGRDFASMVGEILDTEFAVPKNGWQNSGVAASKTGILEWRTLDAQYFGVPQRRRRMFALADFGDWQSREPVLFERHSLSGNPAPRREAREDVAGTISSRTTGGGGLGTDFELGGGLQVAPTIRAGAANGGKGHGARSGDSKDELIVPVRVVARSLAIRGRDGTPQAELGDEVANTLVTPSGGRCGIGIGAIMTETLCVATGQAGAEIGVDMATTLNCNHEAPYVAHSLRGEGFDANEDLDQIAGGRHDGVMQSNMQVRRLTPTECARLQGFPDDYLSKVPGASDSAMYKALGNSMAVPCMSWLGRRIEEVAELCSSAKAAN